MILNKNITLFLIYLFIISFISCNSSTIKPVTDTTIDRDYWDLIAWGCDTLCRYCIETDAMGRTVQRTNSNMVKACTERLKEMKEKPDPNRWRCDPVMCDWCEAYNFLGDYLYTVRKEQRPYHWKIAQCIDSKFGPGASKCGENEESRGLLQFHPPCPEKYKFGFDSWHHMSCSGVNIVCNDSTKYLFDGQNTNYMSLKSYDSATITIGVGINPGVYDSIVAKSTSSNLTFKNKPGHFPSKVSQISLNPKTQNLVTVYSGYSGEAEIEILAIGRDTAFLAGQRVAGTRREAVDDRLVIKIYNEKVPTKYNIYTIGRSIFNKDVWADGINLILNQAVIRINSHNVNVIDIPNDKWDVNKNNLIDDFVSYDDVPLDLIELSNILDQIKSDYRDVCWDNREPSSIIFKNRIRDHWLVVEDADSGRSLLVLNSVEGITIGQTIKIGPWMDPTKKDDPALFNTCKISHIDV